MSLTETLNTCLHLFFVMAADDARVRGVVGMR
jgi:hypothetical protein